MYLLSAHVQGIEYIHTDVIACSKNPKLLEELKADYLETEVRYQYEVLMSNLRAAKTDDVLEHVRELDYLIAWADENGLGERYPEELVSYEITQVQCLE